MPVPFRIPIPVFESEGASALWPTEERRKRAEGVNASKPSTSSIIVVAVVLGVIFLVFSIVLVRTLRKRHPNPKYIPTPFLKRLWSDWKVPRRRTGPRYELSPEDDADWSSSRPTRRFGSEEAVGEVQTTQRNRNNRQVASASASASAAATGPNGGVDRNTSVRSVLTLPAYRIQPTDTEQVLGREGERDGIDIVVELPTAEVEEALREEEMDALYQIRVTRRRQIAEREERRRRQQEARERNDTATLEALRRERVAAPDSNLNEVEALRREHERIKATRQRAVSSVSYHEVGIARHDGTRIRANSTESSERVGLLSDAASIAVSTRSASGTAASGPGSLFHRRDRSASSALSIETACSADPPGSPGLGTAGSNYSLHSQARSRANSGPNTPRLSIATSTRPGGPSLDMADAEEADLGNADMPMHSPPGYEDVSLDDSDTVNDNSNNPSAITPVHSRSGANSPYNEPPPDYPGTHVTNLSAATGEEEEGREEEQQQRQNTGPGSGSAGGIPQLPSLRLSRLPQIVIEPSSARPGDD